MPDASATPEELAALLPCPFCGEAPGPIDERHLSPTMKGRGALISASVWHHCPREPGTVHAFIEFRGRDRASAIAAWNSRAAASARNEAKE